MSSPEYLQIGGNVRSIELDAIDSASLSKWDVDGDGKLTKSELLQALHQSERKDIQLHHLRQAVVGVLVVAVLIIGSLSGAMWAISDSQRQLDAQSQGALLTRDGQLASVGQEEVHIPLGAIHFINDELLAGNLFDIKYQGTNGAVLRRVTALTTTPDATTIECGRDATIQIGHDGILSISESTLNTTTGLYDTTHRFDCSACSTCGIKSVLTDTLADALESYRRMDRNCSHALIARQRLSLTQEQDKLSSIVTGRNLTVAVDVPPQYESEEVEIVHVESRHQVRINCSLYPTEEIRDTDNQTICLNGTAVQRTSTALTLRNSTGVRRRRAVFTIFVVGMVKLLPLLSALGTGMVTVMSAVAAAAKVAVSVMAAKAVLIAGKVGGAFAALGKMAKAAVGTQKAIAAKAYWTAKVAPKIKAASTANDIYGVATCVHTFVKDPQSSPRCIIENIVGFAAGPALEGMSGYLVKKGLSATRHVITAKGLTAAGQGLAWLAERPLDIIALSYTFANFDIMALPNLIGDTAMATQYIVGLHLKSTENEENDREKVFGRAPINSGLYSFLTGSLTTEDKNELSMATFSPPVNDYVTLLTSGSDWQAARDAMKPDAVTVATCLSRDQRVALVRGIDQQCRGWFWNRPAACGPRITFPWSAPHRYANLRDPDHSDHNEPWCPDTLAAAVDAVKSSLSMVSESSWRTMDPLSRINSETLDIIGTSPTAVRYLDGSLPICIYNGMVPPNARVTPVGQYLPTASASRVAIPSVLTVNEQNIDFLSAQLQWDDEVAMRPSSRIQVMKFTGSMSWTQINRFLLVLGSSGITGSLSIESENLRLHLDTADEAFVLENANAFSYALSQLPVTLSVNMVDADLLVNNQFDSEKVQYMKEAVVATVTATLSGSERLIAFNMPANAAAGESTGEHMCRMLSTTAGLEEISMRILEDSEGYIEDEKQASHDAAISDLIRCLPWIPLVWKHHPDPAEVWDMIQLEHRNRLLDIGVPVTWISRGDQTPEAIRQVSGSNWALQTIKVYTSSWDLDVSDCLKAALANVGIVLDLVDVNNHANVKRQTLSSPRGDFTLERCGSIVEDSEEPDAEVNWFTMYFGENEMRVWNPVQWRLDGYSSSQLEGLHDPWDPAAQLGVLADGKTEFSRHYCRFSLSDTCHVRCEAAGLANCRKPGDKLEIEETRIVQTRSGRGRWASTGWEARKFTTHVYDMPTSLRGVSAPASGCDDVEYDSVRGLTSRAYNVQGELQLCHFDGQASSDVRQSKQDIVRDNAWAVGMKVSTRTSMAGFMHYDHTEWWEDTTNINGGILSVYGDEDYKRMRPLSSQTREIAITFDLLGNEIAFRTGDDRRAIPVPSDQILRLPSGVSSFHDLMKDSRTNFYCKEMRQGLEAYRTSFPDRLRGFMWQRGEMPSGEDSSYDETQSLRPMSPYTSSHSVFCFNLEVYVHNELVRCRWGGYFSEGAVYGVGCTWGDVTVGSGMIYKFSANSDTRTLHQKAYVLVR
eukprot:TRINITY_DN11370_c0_g1_i1.p1 TRINITY_DN11370_c0_g1~~TRINITY_DN11370_c0_g1_i1.p1  ORF type:complete len:1513 (+),score=251.43 TRINITY_DN11370_c0_g1_i1:47-4540(+)